MQRMFWLARSNNVTYDFSNMIIGIEAYRQAHLDQVDTKKRFSLDTDPLEASEHVYKNEKCWHDK